MCVDRSTWRAFNARVLESVIEDKGYLAIVGADAVFHIARPGRVRGRVLNGALAQQGRRAAHRALSEVQLGDAPIRMQEKPHRRLADGVAGPVLAVEEVVPTV